MVVSSSRLLLSTFETLLFLTPFPNLVEDGCSGSWQVSSLPWFWMILKDSFSNEARSPSDRRRTSRFPPVWKSFYNVYKNLCCLIRREEYWEEKCLPRNNLFSLEWLQRPLAFSHELSPNGVDFKKHLAQSVFVFVANLLQTFFAADSSSPSNHFNSKSWSNTTKYFYW